MVQRNTLRFPAYPGFETWEERSWKERREAIQRWVSIHPSVVDILSWLFFQGRRFKAYRTIEKMREKGELPHIGTVKLGDWRPADIYASWKPKEDNYRHELELTRFCACFPKAEWLRGYDTDRALLPDAEMRLGEFHAYVELHTGSMRGTKAAERICVYRDSTRPVLWVAVDQTGAEYLLELLPENHFVATLENIQSAPHGPVWSYRVNNGDLTLVKKAALEP